MEILSVMFFCMLGFVFGIAAAVIILTIKHNMGQHPIPWKTETIEKHFGGGFSIRDANDHLVWWENYLLPLRFIVRIVNTIGISERHPTPWKICKQPLVGWLSIRDANDHLVCWGNHLILLQFIVGVINGITGLKVTVVAHHL